MIFIFSQNLLLNVHLADGSELVEVDNYVQANQASPNEEMFGKYAGSKLNC